MVDEGSACAALSSALSLQIEEAKVVSSKDVKSKKKELSLKMDKELAAVLLDNYANQKGRRFR